MNTIQFVPLTATTYDQWALELATVYVQCFAQAPWYEVFDPNAVASRLYQALTLDDAVLLAAVDPNRAVGATLFYPLQNHRDVSSIVKLERAMYCDELFIAPEHQRKGIGSRLFDTATGMTIAKGYRHRVLRTSQQAPDLQHFYASRGYESVAKMKCTSLKRIDGHTRTEEDIRVIMVQGDHHV